MAWTQEDLDNVEAAMASGVKAVTHSDGRKVEYPDLDALRDVRALIMEELAGPIPGVAGDRFSRVTVSRS